MHNYIKENKLIFIQQPFNELIAYMSGRFELTECEWLFWWCSRIIRYTNHFKNTKQYQQWINDGMKLNHLSKLSISLIENNLIDIDCALVLGFVIADKENHNFKKELCEASAKLSSDPHLVYNELMFNTITFIKSNWPDTFYKKHKKDFDDFLNKKKISKRIYSYYDFIIQAEFTLSSFENKIASILKSKTSFDRINRLWTLYNNSLDMFTKYGFVLANQPQCKLSYNEICKKTMAKFESQTVPKDFIKTMAYITDPNNEWELDEKQLLEREFILSQLMNNFFDSINNEWNYVVKISHLL